MGLLAALLWCVGLAVRAGSAAFSWEWLGVTATVQTWVALVCGATLVLLLRPPLPQPQSAWDDGADAAAAATAAPALTDVGFGWTLGLTAWALAGMLAALLLEFGLRPAAASWWSVGLLHTLQAASAIRLAWGLGGRLRARP